MSPNAFKSVMDIDVLGTFNTIKATIPHLLKSSSPRIIYVSATFHYTGMPLQAHVSAAKAAIDSLMASVALEYGPRGVQSNVISPGAIEDTEGAAAAVSHYDRALALDPDFADAHFNVAGLCEQLGRGADALRHYHAYKKLTDA